MGLTPRKDVGKKRAAGYRCIDNNVVNEWVRKGDIEKVMKGAQTPEQVRLMQEALKRVTGRMDALGIVHEAVAQEVKLRELQSKCKESACQILRRVVCKHLLRVGFSTLRVPHAAPPPPPMDDNTLHLAKLEIRIKDLEERVKEEAEERAQIEGRVLGLVMGSMTSSDSPRKPHTLPITRHAEIPQDPTKLFRSLSHSSGEGGGEGVDGEDDVYNEGGDVDDKNEDEEGRFFELPSTSHRSPLAPQYFSSSIERRLERINERVDKILAESTTTK
ncbi:hypothetical protein TrRE_jg9145 [Triparma retinervis]|uniref:Uncharacterized protein n=1 Tax=Triparma retinervis TaxID=2557542 RepID=A0A9W7KUP6_9STRA|nr:hypothetical protein TrRE_jg9145 [Triparma retinervis]